MGNMTQRLNINREGLSESGGDQKYTPNLSKTRVSRKPDI